MNSESILIHKLIVHCLHCFVHSDTDIQEYFKMLNLIIVGWH